MTNKNLENLKKLLAVPDLASKKWVYEQYDSQVMNDTLETKSDAALVRVRDSQKALAISSDCTPRYIEADSYEGAIQAVAETYRNISACGAKPLAITNCLNFGNPQKPQIMGQIVRAIKGITAASKFLDYPVVSGNVSLYNETDGQAIQPTPTIGGVGLLKDLNKRTDAKFKNASDVIMVIGENKGHMSCSLFEREIGNIESKENPPKVALEEELKNAEFVRDIIAKSLVNSCHDISDGGLLVNLFESSTSKLGCKINLKENLNNLSEEEFLFSEDQSRYVISVAANNIAEIEKIAAKSNVKICQIGEVINDNINLDGAEIKVDDLIKINEEVFYNKFS